MSDARRQATTTRVPVETGQSIRLEIPGLRFLAVSGPEKGRAWTVGHEVVRIGTDPENDLVLADPTVSRFHAVVDAQESGLLLRDLESKNGTYVGDVRVVSSYVKPGQRMSLGQTSLEVEASHATFVGLPAGESLGAIVGSSPRMRELFTLVAAAAPSTATILITGESGTGKELFAREVHELSGRRGPFVAFDCGRAMNDLFSSELFGHVKGAFTGAESARPGAMRSAHGGTLFLDEVGELSAELQAALLRTLQTREVRPTGSDQSHPVDVRVVSATNRDLRSRVAEGKFREDLYYRLNVIELTLPPLRERTGDIPAMVHHMLKGLGSRLELTAEAMQILGRHPWRGNARELHNVLERLTIVCRGRPAGAGDLAFLDPGDPSAAGASPGRILPLAEQEREIILRSYEQLKRNKKQTARALGISLSTLKRKLVEYGVADAGDGADEPDA